MDAVRLRPRDIITRESIENAVSVIMATGGSTNAVLHLAIAHAAEVHGLSMTRAHPPARAGAVRPETFRTLRRDGSAPRRRHSAGHVVECGPAAWRLHHHHRQDHRRNTGGARRAARRPGRHHAAGPRASSAGPPRHPEGQSVAGRLRGPPWPEEPGHHRAGPRVRLRGRCHGGYHGPQDSAWRRGGDSLRRPRGGPGCARCWRQRRRWSGRGWARPSA